MLRIKFPPETTNIAEAIKHCCRLCLKDIESGSNIYAVFTDQIYGTLIHRLISHFFRVDLNPDHGQSMCELCFQHLVNTKKFSDTITKSNGILEASIEEHFKSRKEPGQLEFATIDEDGFNEESELDIKEEVISDWEMSSESGDNLDGRHKRELPNSTQDPILQVLEENRTIRQELTEFKSILTKLGERWGVNVAPCSAFTAIDSKKTFHAMNKRLRNDEDFTLNLISLMKPKVSSISDVFKFLFEEYFMYSACNWTGSMNKICLKSSGFMQILLPALFPEMTRSNLDSLAHKELERIKNKMKSKLHYQRKGRPKKQDVSTSSGADELNIQPPIVSDKNTEPSGLDSDAKFELG